MGFSNCKLLEKVQLRFLKSIFNLKSSTPNIFVYGVYPIEIDIQARMVSFWTKLVSENESNKVSSIYITSCMLNIGQKPRHG